MRKSAMTWSAAVKRWVTTLTMGGLLAACSSGSEPQETGPDQPTSGHETVVEVDRGEIPRERPPASGEARDVQFPAVTRTQTSSGLEVNTVSFGNLPLVYLRLVVRSGSAQDPEELRGLAHFVAEMLKEGTATRTSAQLAEQVEFLGADLSVGSDEENVYVMVRALSEHLDQAMELLADVALHPRFQDMELRRLKARELDRLRLSSQQPRYLARRELYRYLYGSHPYAFTDTTPEVVSRISRGDLRRWHRHHFAPNNAFMIAVGNVDANAVQRAAEEQFSEWRSRSIPDTVYPEPPARQQREVIVVDRPQSVQSVIFVGNLALTRNDDAYIPLTVANQVLGGSAASRLFMDLREQRSLTYGAYSFVSDRAQIAPWAAYAAVRNEVTAEAMQGFFEHLDRIVAEAPSEEELGNARRYLSDRFPLQIETASRVASMVEELRVFDLPDDYWAGYRSSIGEVSVEEAHGSARRFITPDLALVVAVGRASAIVEPLRRYGPVRVLDTDGNEVTRFDAISED